MKAWRVRSLSGSVLSLTSVMLKSWASLCRIQSKLFIRMFTSMSFGLACSWTDLPPEFPCVVIRLFSCCLRLFLNYPVVILVIQAIVGITCAVVIVLFGELPNYEDPTLVKLTAFLLLNVSFFSTVSFACHLKYLLSEVVVKNRVPFIAKFQPSTSSHLFWTRLGRLARSKGAMD